MSGPGRPRVSSSKPGLRIAKAIVTLCSDFDTISKRKIFQQAAPLELWN